MTEESGEPKPRKLKLSSSRNQLDKQETAPAPQESTPQPTPVTPQTEVPKPKVTLRTSTPATPTTTTPAAEPTPPPQAKQPAPAQAVPPPLTTAPAPRISDSAPQPSADIAQPTASTPEKSNPLGSILIIATLFLILAAAGGGIWYILQNDQSEATDEVSSQKNSLSNSIERAKAAVDSVPVQALNEVIDTPAAPTPDVATNNKTTESAKNPEALKEAVSQYLQSVHIGGIRTGARARIMLNGDNYNINDTVDAATGLVFIGTRDQKLLFQDPNGVTYAKSF